MSAGEPTTHGRETWSPNWANTWVGRTSWGPHNIGKVALVARSGIGHERLVSIGNTARELLRDFPEYLTEARRRMVRIVDLTVDDDPSKVYVYLPERADVVYYALGEKTGVVKVGTSKWVEARMLELPAARHGPWRLLAVEPGDEYVERYRHGQFGHLWIPNYGKGESRELFAPGPPLLEHINALLAEPPQWFKPADIDLTATRLVLDGKVEAPTYTGTTEPMTAEQVALRQQAVLRATMEENTTFKARRYKYGAFD